MYEEVLTADKAGLQVMVHAIGDRANDAMLSIYERVAKENGTRDRRFRIEHAQHLRPQDIKRFGADKIIASMQPFHLADDGRWNGKRLDKERLKGAYAFRPLLDTGAVLAFGTDSPVAPINPLLGIYTAVTRRTLDGRNPAGVVSRTKNYGRRSRPRLHRRVGLREISGKCERRNRAGKTRRFGDSIGRYFYGKSGRD